MSNRVSLTARDFSLLRLLDWTPATTSLLLLASEAFEGGAFADERRLRERLQALAKERIVRSWRIAAAGGGLENYYKLTPLGFAMLHGAEATLPPRAAFSEVSPSLAAHTFQLAEVIVAMLRSCRRERIQILRFLRENELTFRVGESQVQPDCFFRLSLAGKTFNLAFEIDNGTESLDSYAMNSLRTKLSVYEAYQEQLLAEWRKSGRRWERPRLRVIFLPKSIARAYHILALAAQTSRNHARKLVYAASRDAFLAEDRPLTRPLFLDHQGCWKSLVTLHSSVPERAERVRLPGIMEPIL